MPQNKPQNRYYHVARNGLRWAVKNGRFILARCDTEAEARALMERLEGKVIRLAPVNPFGSDALDDAEDPTPIIRELADALRMRNGYGARP